MHSIRSRFAAAEASKNISHHVRILWDLTDIQTCTLSYPQEAESVGKSQELTCGDKALVLCELSAMLGQFYCASVTKFHQARHVCGRVR